MNNNTKLTTPPLAIAISLSVFFLLSPKPGAFTEHTCSPTFNLQIKTICCQIINSEYHSAYYTEDSSKITDGIG